MKSNKKLFVALALLLLVALAAVEILREKIFLSYENGELIYVIASRALGGVACMMLILCFSFRKMLSPRTSLKALLFFLPCMAVAINNFPFIPFFSGRAYVDAAANKVVLYALSCLLTGFFEEMAFRGCIFSSLLQRKSKKWTDVFWATVFSSAIFGVVHIVNIFMGASIGAVLLQIGYSFLIGAMCAVVLVKTSNIWYCVVLHAVYNFAGGVVPECGGGVLWDTPTVVITTLIAIAVAVYVTVSLTKIKQGEIASFLNEQEIVTQNNDN